MKKQTFENISGPLCPTRRLFSRLGLFIVRPSCRVRPVVADVTLRPSVRPVVLSTPEGCALAVFCFDRPVVQQESFSVVRASALVLIVV